MGRTIHYGFKLSKDLPIEKINKLLDLTEEYNTKYVWTCENVGFSNFLYYPNWHFWRKTKGEDYPNNKIWEAIDKAFKINEKAKMNYVDNVMDLRAKKIINFHATDDLFGLPELKEWRGFTKTQGNEWNSFLVVMWLVEVSKLIPTASISVYDEGEFIKLPILIKNGKAKPDSKRIQSQLKHYQKNATEYWAIEGLKKYKDGISEYKTEVINNRNPFVSVALFTRPVNPKDFENHPEFKTVILTLGEKTTSNFTNIMAGFSGEYWDKGKKELVEHRSQENTEFMINFINGMFTKKEDDK